MARSKFDISELFDHESLVGMTYDHAREAAKNSGYRVRVVRKDGRPYVITANLRLDRVNLEIENGTVVKSHLG